MIKISIFKYIKCEKKIIAKNFDYINNLWYYQYVSKEICIK